MSIFIALLLAAGPGAGDPAVGLWTNPKESLQVRTRRCGAQLCGTIVGATEHAVVKARDKKLPPLVGTELFYDYRPDGQGSWAGTLFVPDRNRKVSSTLVTDGGRTLKITGCLLGRFFCKSQVWTRVERNVADR